MGPGEDTELSRRSLLRAGAAAGIVVAAGCGSPAVPSPDPPAPASARPARSPDPAAVLTGPASEADHARSGRPEVALTSHGAGDLDLARRIPTGLHDRDAAVTVLTDGPGAFFRQSRARRATAEVRRIAGATGYPVVLSHDVDSRDFSGPGATAVRHYVAAAGPGSVVSMHLRHPGTLDALPGTLDDLAARGLTPVTAGHLFG